MTSRLNRLVKGYPIYNFVGAIGAIAVQATVTINMPSGPGELLGFGILCYSGTLGDFNLSNYKLVVDGATIYDSYLCWLSGYYLAVAGHGMHSTIDAQTSSLGAYSHRFRVSYESTASIAFKNQGGASISLGIGAHVRMGA